MYLQCRSSPLIIFVLIVAKCLLRLLGVRWISSEASWRCAVESTDVFKSYDANWKDFEDGVQYHVAIRNSADYLVTRNTKDFEENEIEVISLDWACKLLQKGE